MSSGNGNGDEPYGPQITVPPTSIPPEDLANKVLEIDAMLAYGIAEQQRTAKVVKNISDTSHAMAAVIGRIDAERERWADQIQEMRKESKEIARAIGKLDSKIDTLAMRIASNEKTSEVAFAKIHAQQDSMLMRLDGVEDETEKTGRHFLVKTEKKVEELEESRRHWIRYAVEAVVGFGLVILGWAADHILKAIWK